MLLSLISGSGMGDHICGSGVACQAGSCFSADDSCPAGEAVSIGDNIVKKEDIMG